MQLKDKGLIGVVVFTGAISLILFWAAMLVQAWQSRLPTDGERPQVKVQSIINPGGFSMPPYRMLVLTDSTGLGVLADTYVGMPVISRLWPMLHLTMLLDLFEDHPQGQNTFNKTFMTRISYLSSLEHSAFASQNPWSIPARISQKLRRPVELTLVGRMGASYDPRADLDLGGLRDEYDAVIVNLGSMDLLLKMPVATFARHCAAFLHRLQATFAKARVFVNKLPQQTARSPRPDQSKAAFSGAFDLGPSIHEMGTLFYGTAQSPLTQASPLDMEDLALAMNRVLVAQATTEGALTLYDYSLGISGLHNGLFAIDNLHLSLDGQKVIAEAITLQLMPFLTGTAAR